MKSVVVMTGAGSDGLAGTARGLITVRQRVHNWFASGGDPGRLENARVLVPRESLDGFDLYRFAAARSRLPSLTFCCPRISARGDCLKVVVQLQGTCTMRTRRSVATLVPSEWTFHNYASDLEISLTPDAEQLHLLFPADIFCSKLLTTETRVMSFGASAGVPRIAGGFLRLLSSEWPYLSGGEKTDMIQTAAQLVQLAISEQQAMCRMTRQETLRERVKAHVARNLRDHKLTIEQIAGVLGCTKRNLHKVFRDDAHTLSAYIWDLRLQRCAADFSDPSRAHESITQIAFAWGFNNAAHFSRLFRRRYGVSASQFRVREAPPAAH